MRITNQTIGRLFLFRKMGCYFMFAYLNVALIVEVSSGNFLKAMPVLSHLLPNTAIIYISFHGMARMHTTSMAVLRLWSHCEGELEEFCYASSPTRQTSYHGKEGRRVWRRYTKAVLRSMPEIQFSASDMYGIKWLTTLSYFYAITCNTISIFIGIKSKQLF